MKGKSESEVSQSCPTLCNPMDCRLPGSSVHAIFQARVLEWGAITFSAIHSSILVWEIPWAEGWRATVHGLARSRTRLRDFTFTFHFHALEKEMATYSSVLAWRIPGSLVGCRLWGRRESDTTEVT